MKLEVVTCSGVCAKHSAAKMLGLEVFDTALPAPWLDRTVENLQKRISSETATTNSSDPENMRAALLSTVVWYYPKGSIFGMPYPLTVRGAMLLKLADELNETSYMEALPEMKVLGLMEEGRVL